MGENELRRRIDDKIQQKAKDVQRNRAAAEQAIALARLRQSEAAELSVRHKESVAVVRAEAELTAKELKSRSTQPHCVAPVTRPTNYTRLWLLTRDERSAPSTSYIPYRSDSAEFTYHFKATGFALTEYGEIVAYVQSISSEHNIAYEQTTGLPNIKLIPFSIVAISSPIDITGEATDTDLVSIPKTHNPVWQPEKEVERWRDRFAELIVNGKVSSFD